jgi:hypothetical protein
MKNLASLLLSVIALFFIAGKANAAPAGIYTMQGAGTKGLCTQHDAGEKWVDEEWCKTIYDQITGRNSSDLCASDLFAELKEKIKNGQFEGLDDYCPGYREKMARQPDSDAFIAGLIQQIIATLVICESEWNVGAEGPPITKDGVIVMDGKKGEERTQTARGLMQLSAKSVGADMYKCGCAEVKSDEQLQTDPKLNLKCGTHIAMYWMVKDSELGSGSGNADGHANSAKGIAQYFQPFRDIDMEKRRKMQSKVKTYCDNLDWYKPAGEEGGPGYNGGGSTGSGSPGGYIK